MQRMQNEVQILLKKFWDKECKNSGGNRWKSDHRGYFKYKNKKEPTVLVLFY